MTGIAIGYAGDPKALPEGAQRTRPQVCAGLPSSIPPTVDGAPRWTQGAKDAIGTAYLAGSTVWFTVSDDPRNHRHAGDPGVAERVRDVHRRAASAPRSVRALLTGRIACSRRRPLPLWADSSIGAATGPP